MVLCGALLVGVSCRDLSVCQDVSQCEAGASNGGAPAADAGASSKGGAHAGASAATPGAGQGGESSEGGEGGEGGQGGQGGQAEALVCRSPLDDCDHGPLNGCETDVSNSPNHCGACDEPCSGICALGKCRLPQVASEQAIRQLTPFAATTDHLYFEWGDVGGPFRLSRVDKLGSAPQLVRDQLPEFSSIAATADRIYLWGGANLWSVTLEGNAVDEGFYATAFAACRDTVYAASNGGLLERKVGTTTWEPKPWFTNEFGASLWPVCVGQQVLVFHSAYGQLFEQYELLLVDEPDTASGGLVTLASGAGRVLRVRASENDVYWLVQGPDGDDDVFELRRHGTLLDSGYQLLARERRARDFALDSNFAYLTSWLGTGYQIEVIDVSSISEKVRFGLGFEASYPESAGPFLWYFDAGTARVQRVRLGLGEL